MKYSECLLFIIFIIIIIIIYILFWFFINLIFHFCLFILCGIYFIKQDILHKNQIEINERKVLKYLFDRLIQRVNKFYYFETLTITTWQLIY